VTRSHHMLAAAALRGWRLALLDRRQTVAELASGILTNPMWLNENDRSIAFWKARYLAERKRGGYPERSPNGMMEVPSDAR
jgi:hypothetical protein